MGNYGNKKWSPGEMNKEAASSSSGIEIKTRQGNKQWLSSALVEEKKQQSDGKKRRRMKNSNEIFIRGRRYIMTRNGRSIKRLSSKLR